MASSERRARRFPIGARVSVDALEADPHGLLATLRRYEPVSWLPALDCWLVTSRDLVQRVARDCSRFTVDDPRFSTAQVVGPSMLSLDGAEHDRHRLPFVAPFRPDEVARRLDPLVRASARRLVAALGAGDGAVDGGGDRRAELRRQLAGPLAVEVVLAALGLEGVSTGTVLGWYDAIVTGVQSISAGREAGPAASEAAVALAAAVARQGGAARRAPGSPISAAAASGLAGSEVASNVAVTMFGAIETTEGMIANAALHLLSHPDELERVRREPALLAGAVEESLRYEPAAAVIDRYATGAVRLAGAEIAAGDLVRLSLTAANRDPAVFADPDRFDIRRPNARLHLAFATGPHACLGAALARAEAVASLEALLGLPGLRLDPQRPSAARGLVFRKPPALHVLVRTGTSPVASE